MSTGVLIECKYSIILRSWPISDHQDKLCEAPRQCQSYQALLDYGNTAITVRRQWTVSRRHKHIYVGNVCKNQTRVEFLLSPETSFPGWAADCDWGNAEMRTGGGRKVWIVNIQFVAASVNHLKDHCPSEISLEGWFVEIFQEFQHYSLLHKFSELWFEFIRSEREREREREREGDWSQDLWQMTCTVIIIIYKCDLVAQCHTRL